MERASLSAEQSSGDRAGADVPATLIAILEELVAAPGLGPIEATELDTVLRRHPKDGRGFHSKKEILHAFRATASRWSVEAETFALRLRTCPTRSQSGILPVTVLTKPFPCPGRCVFCPDDVRMPKSYLADEPGCQRALVHEFDPYRQTWSRLDAYREMGHRTGKVELIVLGGTWSSYPERYQRWFVARCFEALNDFGAGRDGRAEASGPAAEDVPWDRVEAAHRTNEGAATRCVGLSFETRPDHVDAGEVLRLRRLGATKVQLGLQSLSDDVLAANRRGHDVASSRAAMVRLRRAGFKLHVHWMPNLVGADVVSDRRDFGRLFEDPALLPDELKIYPCSLLETADLMQVHARGEWAPYAHEELVELLADCLPRVPAWCRVTRVIRDIPSPDIVVGNRQTNLREVVEARVQASGRSLREIRSREVRGAPLAAGRRIFLERAYASHCGEERFFEVASEEGRIAAFLRLTLPHAATPFEAPEELNGAALLREVHVYGPAASLGERSAGSVQHAGLGGELVRRAAEHSRDAGFASLAVISAVGTRGWYRRLGFRDGERYQHLALR